MRRRSVAALLERLPAPIDLDAHLAAVNPLWGHRTRGVVESVRPVTPTAASIVLRVGAGWSGHRPGQFVTVGVDVDGVRHRRCYSITSVPDRRRLEITVQATADGIVSNHLVHRCRPGTVLQIDGPDGDFVLPPDLAGTRLLFVTAGSGITPVMGMLRSLPLDGGGVDAVLLHHAPSPDRVLFAPELAVLSARPWLRTDVALTRAPAGDPANHLSAERLERCCADWRERRAYVCGPEPLLDGAVDLWGAAGRDERLRLERFSPVRPAAPTADGGTARVRFDRSGVEVDAAAGAPLLEVAEAAGLRPAHGCRMGICRTCSVRLEAGTTRDLRDGRAGVAGRHVQICVHEAVDGCVVDL